MFSPLDYFRDQSPPVNPKDQVIPLHWFEDGIMWKQIIVYALYVFDDRLDPGKLRVSLERLVERDGYRKLGARLRRNVATGIVEYHVPTKFGPSRPAVAFTHTHFDKKAASHPVGAKIPKPSIDRPAIVGNPEDLSDFMRGGNDGRPMSIEDYLTTDRSILGIHVTTFKDRSCISFSWPHLSFDAMGMKAVIEGWVLSLQGRESEIPTPIGYDTDPLAEFGLHATEKHLLADRRMSLPSQAAYALRNILGLIGPKETRMMCVPAAFWQRMLADVRRELAEEARKNNEPEPFVTEGNVLSAWWMRLLVLSAVGRDSMATVTAENVMSLRKVLADDLLPSGQPFVSVALGYPTISYPACELLSKPLSWLALEFRRAIDDQGSREQVEAYAGLQRAYNDTTRMFLLIGDMGMYNFLFSNWQKAELFKADFSAATTKPRKTPLQASYIQCVQDPGFPEGWPISGKDNKGNYWMSGFRSKGLWAKLEVELEKQLQEGTY